MKRWMIVAAAVVLLGVIGFVGFRMMRGPTGASDRYGGSIAAVVIEDFPTLDKGSWAYGDPTSLASLRGAPVLVEVWSPS